MTYGIQHKDTGKWFGGFDGNKTLWVEKAKARAMDFLSAKGQAALFLSSMGGENVQRKPKELK